MANHPNRSKKLIYYWDGSHKFNNATGFNERVAIRSDGKEVMLSSKRMGILLREKRLNLPIERGTT